MPVSIFLKIFVVTFFSIINNVLGIYPHKYFPLLDYLLKRESQDWTLWIRIAFLLEN